MLIATGTLDQQTLADHVAIVTGAGGGIGYEAARALLWLGARVVVAEINARKGRRAAALLAEAFGADVVRFIRTDVGAARSVARLRRRSRRHFGRVDIVLNNATVAPLGPVTEVPIGEWDLSYRVNIRGPALLARAFIPDMVARDHGVFLCVSSVGMAYMAAYESMKAAQVHLAATLDAELEGTGVHAFTIGPGFVPTATASGALPKLARMMGEAPEALAESLAANTLSVEAAGAGFAAAVAQAARYRGQEISSVQALLDSGINVVTETPTGPGKTLTTDQFAAARALIDMVRRTLAEQSAGWQERNLFERQWMVRTFRAKARMPVADWLQVLDEMAAAAQREDGARLLAVRAPLDSLAGYYAYLYGMAEGYLKDPDEREEQLCIVAGWKTDVERLHALLSGDDV